MKYIISFALFTLPLGCEEEFDLYSLTDCGRPGNVCPQDFECCGPDVGCIDFETNEEHCGACNNVCTMEETCQEGTCLEILPMEYMPFAVSLFPRVMAPIPFESCMDDSQCNVWCIEHEGRDAGGCFLYEEDGDCVCVHSRGECECYDSSCMNSSECDTWCIEHEGRDGGGCFIPIDEIDEETCVCIHSRSECECYD